MGLPRLANVERPPPLGGFRLLCTTISSYCLCHAPHSVPLRCHEVVSPRYSLHPSGFFHRYPRRGSFRWAVPSYLVLRNIFTTCDHKNRNIIFMSIWKSAPVSAYPLPAAAIPPALGRRQPGSLKNA
ncbi:hypothetical protein B0H14DRAFT_2583606 [Mycena olivaceomarginata]|nr:hypothetical protein B0H14DRAFT_2583606 [Mycena olivaceomarginata]